jgi:3-dehydroquinate dehydratase-2
MKKILIINGPNLNLTGQREKDIYGSNTFDQYLQKLRESFSDVRISYFQSNVEGELINQLQKADQEVDGIILNAGGYTHTSVAMGDTVKAIQIPVIEVHLSNILSREEFRHKSLIAPGCLGSVFGLGLDSYRLAIYYFTIR